MTAEPEADNSLSLVADYRPLELERKSANSGKKNKVRDKLVML